MYIYIYIYIYICVCVYIYKTSDNAIVKRELLNLEKCLCDISV